MVTAVLTLGLWLTDISCLRIHLDHVVILLHVPSRVLVKDITDIETGITQVSNYKPVCTEWWHCPWIS